MMGVPHLFLTDRGACVERTYAQERLRGKGASRRTIDALEFLRGEVRGVKIVVEGEEALTVTNQFNQVIESQRPDIRSQPGPNRQEPVQRREIITALRGMGSFVLGVAVGKGRFDVSVNSECN